MWWTWQAPRKRESGERSLDAVTIAINIIDILTRGGRESTRIKECKTTDAHDLGIGVVALLLTANGAWRGDIHPQPVGRVAVGGRDDEWIPGEKYLY